MPVEPPERPRLALPAAILGAGALIAFSVVFTFRYSVEPVPPRPAAIRFDRWTGEMRWCSTFDEDRAVVLNCEK